MLPPNSPAHRIRVLCGLSTVLAILWFGTAAAQTDAPASDPRCHPVPPPTLHLAATGSVQLAPDELVASLAAIQISNTAISAQR